MRLGEQPATVHRPGRLAIRRRITVVLALIAVQIVAACGDAGPGPTGTPAGSPPAGRATDVPGSPPTPGPIGTPVAGAWPAGWESAFCAMFGQLVETQELAVDIGRALDEGARRDARGLTAELAASATRSRELLGEIPEWPPDERLREDVTALLDLADEMALRYDRHLNDRRRRALAAAQRAGAEMGGVVESLLDKVVLLSDEGLSCPGLTFQLETPPSQ